MTNCYLNLERLATTLTKFPSYLDGKQCVTEMKNAGDRNSNQMYWHGWFCQYWCKEHFKYTMIVPSPISYKNGKVRFDAFFNNCDIDFKAHDEREEIIPLNDTQGILEAITKIGKVRFIIFLGRLIPDSDGSFKRWHDQLKGGLSKYELDRVKRGAKSRGRFKAFEVNRISMFDIDEESYKKTITFQKGFRNSNGKPRNAKLSINYKEFKNELVDLVTFTHSKPKIVNGLDQFFEFNTRNLL